MHHAKDIGGRLVVAHATAARRYSGFLLRRRNWPDDSEPFHRVVLSLGLAWPNLAWQLDDRACEDPIDE